MKKIILALAIVIATVSIAAADTFYLRDGRTVRGTMLGFVNGRFVVRVENRYSTTSPDSNIQRNRGSEGDIQYFRPEEIDRIEIEGRSMDEARWETKDVQVTLESNWVDSGIFLRRGERVQVSASGVITVGRSRISPDGLRSTDPNAPLPTAAEGKLIGAVGNDSRSPILELGSNREFTADRNGRLFLTANRSSFADARGAFSVQIKRERSLTARDTQEDRETGIRSRDGDGGRSSWQFAEHGHSHRRARGRADNHFCHRYDRRRQQSRPGWARRRGQHRLGHKCAARSQRRRGRLDRLHPDG
jgi:hypothetical protein